MIDEMVDATDTQRNENKTYCVVIREESFLVVL
jgi:hypothetical protein